MIKSLISLIVLLNVFSCQQVKDSNVSKVMNKGITKIEKIIEKPNEISKSNSLNKVNNSIFYYLEDPYYIEGVKYIPEENYNYNEIGLSTYYGKELHNVKTINNDLNKVTELVGRHKTLPVPSMVKITNLDNGLSINIKIIDRHNDNAALIQVSRKVAQLLGFYKNKIATVRVEILSDASKQWKNVAMSLNEPQFDETISSSPTSVVSITEIDDVNIENKDINKESFKPIELNTEEVEEYNLFLKIFNFESYTDIDFHLQKFNDKYKYTSEKNGSLYDLIIGPLDKAEINKLVPYFISKGYKETDIILK